MDNRKILSWVIVLSPWLSIYATFIDGVSIGDLSLIIALTIQLFKKFQGINKKNSYLLVYLLYCFFSIIALYFFVPVNVSMVLKRFVKLSLFFVFILIIDNKIDQQLFASAFSFFSRVLCGVVLIQFIIYSSFHYYVEFKIPFLHYCNDAADLFDYVASRSSSFRASSLFLEPAHFTYYISTYIAFLLFDYSKKKNTKRVIEAVVSTICMILSTSSTAIVAGLLVWFLFVFNTIINKRQKLIKKMVLVVFVLLVLILFVLVLLKSDILSFGLNRMLFSKNHSLATSVWGRLDSGNNYYSELPLLYKIIGNGIGNMPSSSSYFNGFFYILYCSGIIGLIIIFGGIIKTFFCSAALGKVISILLIAFSFSSPIIVSIYIILFYTLINRDRKVRTVQKKEEVIVHVAKSNHDIDIKERLKYANTMVSAFGEDKNIHSNGI